jgi:hypothetical protein
MTHVHWFWLSGFSSFTIDLRFTVIRAPFVEVAELLIPDT